MTPTFYYFFIIFLTCYISVPSFIYNLCYVLLLENHLKFSSSEIGHYLYLMEICIQFPRPSLSFFYFPFCLMCKAFSKKVNFMLTLSLIFSIGRYEIHGNMHKCGKTYSKITKRFTDTIKQIFSLGFLGFLT